MKCCPLPNGSCPQVGERKPLALIEDRVTAFRPQEARVLRSWSGIATTELKRCVVDRVGPGVAYLCAHSVAHPLVRDKLQRIVIAESI